MKNVLRITLALVALAVFSTPASALKGQTVGAHLNQTNLFFRSKAAANEAPGFVDSTIASGVGVAGVWPFDTTAAVYAGGWYSSENTAAGDSTDYITLLISDATGSGCQSGVDSFYVAVQVSADGTTWATPKTFVGGTAPTIVDRLPHTNVAGGFRGCLTLNGASLALGAPIWMVRYRTKDLTTPDELADCNLRTWPYLRWIIGTHDAGGYIVKASVVHYDAFQ